MSSLAGATDRLWWRDAVQTVPAALRRACLGAAGAVAYRGGPDIAGLARRLRHPNGTPRRVFYVCSYGGCGSTMLSRFLGRYGDAFHVHSRYPPARLTELTRTPHYPHFLEWFSDQPVADVGRHTVIFLFRHPTYAQLARAGAGGRVYHAIHQKNIQVAETLPPDLRGYVEACRMRGRELLGFGEFFHNYVDRGINRDYDIICVDYERLWDHRPEFLAAIGLDAGEAIRFPERKRGRRSYDESLVRDLNVINAALIERIARMPAVLRIRPPQAEGRDGMP